MGSQNRDFYQNVLVLDATLPEPCLVLVEVNRNSTQTRCRILDAIQLGCSLADIREAIKDNASSEPIDSNPQKEAPPNSTDLGASPQKSSEQIKEALRRQLSEALAKIGSDWTNFVVVIDQSEYVSFNVELPFKDSRSLSRIIELEVQDRVPFEVSDFVIDFRVISPLASGGYDVRVGLIPKTVVAQLLSILRKVNLEPIIFTTVTGALSGVALTAGTYLRPNAALLKFGIDSCSVCVLIDGQVKADRVIPVPSALLQSAGFADLQKQEALQELWRRLFTDLRLFLNSAEARYSTTLEQVYLLTDRPHADPTLLPLREIQQVLARPTEYLASKDLLTESAPALNALYSGIAVFAAPFAIDFAPPPCPVNFRAGDYSYSPQLTEVLNGLKRLGPYIGAALFCLVLALGGIFILREYQLNHLKSAVAAKIRNSVPHLPVNAKEPALPLIAAINELNSTLKDLGTPSRTSPLEILLILTQSLPKLDDVHFTHVVITGQDIKLKGSANSISDVERIERAFKRIKDIKLTVKTPKITEGFGINNKRTRDFSFDMSLPLE